MTWLEALAGVMDSLTSVQVVDILIRWVASVAPTDQAMMEWRVEADTIRERALLDGVVVGAHLPPDWAEVERTARRWCSAILMDDDGPGWPRAYIGYVVGAVVRFNADLVLGPTRLRLAPHLPGDIPRLSDEVIATRQRFGEMAVRDLSALVGGRSPF